MPVCRECGSTNFLVKDSEGYLCFKCFSKNETVDSEMITIIEESVKKGLVYIDPRYQRRRRRTRSDEK